MCSYLSARVGVQNDKRVERQTYLGHTSHEFDWFVKCQNSILYTLRLLAKQQSSGLTVCRLDSTSFLAPQRIYICSDAPRYIVHSNIYMLLDVCLYRIALHCTAIKPSPLS